VVQVILQQLTPDRHATNRELNKPRTEQQQ
jgi:hypothetical protein